MSQSYIMQLQGFTLFRCRNSSTA